MVAERVDLGRGVRAGRNVCGVEETLEDSFCAELVGAEHYGMGFWVQATVNGPGDFVSSAMVGVLWTAFGTSVAFGYSAVLFAARAVLVARVLPR